MTYAELVGKYMRLKEELSSAYSKPLWETSRIDRLAAELAAIERVMSSRPHH